MKQTEKEFEYVRVINHAEDYVNNHLSEQISLDDLANAMNLSKFHFHRIFTCNSKETVKQFVTRLKMERSAIYLLIRDDLTITDIAQLYGYNDSSTYSKAFKKHFDTSPSEYRIARIDKL